MASREMNLESKGSWSAMRQMADGRQENEACFSATRESKRVSESALRISLSGAPPPTRVRPASAVAATPTDAAIPPSALLAPTGLAGSTCCIHR